MAQPSFDEAYNTLYKGWDRTGAQADYNVGGWKNKAGAQQYLNDGNSGANVSDPVEQARKLRDFNIESNKPAVAALEASKSPLQDRYKSLIDQIKGNQQVATNRQTVSTSNELGRRGIQGGGLYDQTFTDALNPITQQYTGMQADAINGQNTDISNIDTKIASLLSGNPDSAVSGALQYTGLQQQAADRSSQIALQQKQMDQQSAESAAQRSLQEKQLSSSTQNSNLINVGGKLYNTQTGQWISPPSNTSNVSAGW